MCIESLSKELFGNTRPESIAKTKSVLKRYLESNTLNNKVVCCNANRAIKG